MRHFAHALRDEGLMLDYLPMHDGTLGAALADAVRRHRSQRVLLTLPGDWRVLQALRAAVGEVPLDVRDDRHFLSTPAEFAAHAEGRKQLRMELLYREMRRRHAALMDGDAPVGGEWNFDVDNRAAFGTAGPGFVPPTPRFAPDAITPGVIELVRTRFADHPGRLDSFGWPVTRAQALQVLQSFIDERLEHFGRWQDAMWNGEPWLYHAHIAAAMNLKLLQPREVTAAAEAAYRAGRAPLPAVEGFIRQVLGWREYVRGIYWLKMPGYAEFNILGAQRDLPTWYWTGQTSMR